MLWSLDGRTANQPLPASDFFAARACRFAILVRYPVVLWFSRCLECLRRAPGLLHHVHLATGDGAGGDEGAVLSSDEGQVAFSVISAVFSGLQFALEASHAGDRLLRHTLLQHQAKRFKALVIGTLSRKKRARGRDGFHSEENLLLNHPALLE